MGFLRTLFWIAITVVVVVFSLRNWSPVTINLFGDLRADVKLPVLLLITFLLGFGPLYLWHRLTRWRDRRAMATRELPVVPPAPASPVAAPTVPVSPAVPGDIGPARAD